MKTLERITWIVIHTETIEKIKKRNLDILADRKYTLYMEGWIWQEWVDRNRIIRSNTGFLCELRMRNMRIS